MVQPAEFLELTPGQTFVETKLALSRCLRSRRTAQNVSQAVLTKGLKSSQSGDGSCVVPLPGHCQATARNEVASAPQPDLFFSSQIFGSHNSTLFPSGSMIHANFPFSCDSGP